LTEVIDLLNIPTVVFRSVVLVISIVIVSLVLVIAIAIIISIILSISLTALMITLVYILLLAADGLNFTANNVNFITESPNKVSNVSATVMNFWDFAANTLHFAKESTPEIFHVHREVTDSSEDFILDNRFVCCQTVLTVLFFRLNGLENSQLSYMLLSLWMLLPYLRVMTTYHFGLVSLLKIWIFRR
jgi:hypothetical protein